MNDLFSISFDLIVFVVLIFQFHFHFYLVKLFFHFMRQFFRMFKVMMGVFLLNDFVKLDEGRQRKNPTDDPVQDMLVCIDLVRNEPASEDKYQVTDQSSDTNTHDINIIMAVLREQYTFRKQHGAPTE